MASDLMGFVKFSDGTMGSFLDEGATVRVANELQTGGTGLNQTSGVSIGQAYSGKVAIAASIIAVKDGTAIVQGTGDGFAYGYFQGPDGKIICLVQGGGGACSGLAPLSKPVRMQTGIILQGAFEAATDGLCQAHLAVYCTDGTSDVFLAVAVDATATSMINKDSATIGQALDGKTIQSVYATYNSSKGLNEDGAGVGAFYLESSDGQLKMMFPPCTGNTQFPVPWSSGYGTKVDQNDVLYVNGTT